MARAFRLRAPSPWHLVLVPLALVMLVPLIWMLITSLSSLEETRRFPPGLPSSLHWESYVAGLDRLAPRPLAAQQHARLGDLRAQQPGAVQPRRLRVRPHLVRRQPDPVPRASWRR